MAQVKICGLSTEETMQAALDAGADFVGLMFYPKSPRNVSLELAAKLATIAKGRAKIVAVVVDADDALLKAIMHNAEPDYIQAHGSETPQRILEIKNQYGVRVIKVIKVKDAADIDLAKDFCNVADLIMFDPKAPQDTLPGGNGLSFDWNLLSGEDEPFMLAGGLNPDNVAQAIKLTQAPIVDVSSGVETSPGVKDAGLIAKFIRVAKSAGNEDSL
jgi:phosphoribosylanthranilate isomerase